MSQIARIATADTMPADPAERAKAHQGLIDILNAEAERAGWKGAVFDVYTSRGGIAAITIAPGEAPATLDDLRAFRESQKQAAALAAPQANDNDPEQRSLL